MKKINFKSSNKKKAWFSTIIIIFFSIISILIPLILANYIPQSLIGNYIINHVNIIYLTLPLLLYIIIIGVYTYRISIDPYILYIKSSRTISGMFMNTNEIEIPHDILIDFQFFNRPFSINKTLMIKIINNKDNIIAKRFNMTFITKNEERKITDILNKIIASKKKK